MLPADLLHISRRVSTGTNLVHLLPFQGILLFTPASLASSKSSVLANAFWEDEMLSFPGEHLEEKEQKHVLCHSYQRTSGCLLAKLA